MVLYVMFSDNSNGSQVQDFMKNIYCFCLSFERTENRKTQYFCVQSLLELMLK